MSNESIRPRDVFLSYSSRDKNWADSACAVLERHGIRCWIAPRDITPGEEWGAEIIKGINGSRIMVLIFSAHANASGQVRREVERAISSGLPVLPIRVEDVRPEGAMEYALGNTHWLDAFTPPVEKQLEVLARSVKTLLGNDVVARPGGPTAGATDGVGREHLTTATGPAPGPRHLIPLAVGSAVFLAVLVVVGWFVMSRDKAVATVRPIAETVPQSDEDRIQGRWQVVDSIFPQGTVAKKKSFNAAYDPSKMVWTFRGRQLTTYLVVDGHDEVQDRGTFSLSKGHERKFFDYMSTRPDGKPFAFAGIYEFDGEFFRVCYGVRTDPAEQPADSRRPDSFLVTHEGFRRVYLKFRRVGG